MLELYHWEPTFDSAEPLVALKEKELEARLHYVDLLRLQQHEPAHLQVSPSGQVPVLIHDGRVIDETGLILEYLEDAFPATSLRPAALPAQYRARFWIKYAEERIAPYAWVLGWHAVGRQAWSEASVERARRSLPRLPVERRELWHKALADGWSDEELALARESLMSATGLLESSLRESPWLAGERYSIADIALVFMARALRAIAPNIVSAERTPQLLEWLRRLEQRPAIASTLALARVEAPERTFVPGPEPPRWG